MGLFFELIQVALGIRNRLSRKPTDEEWDCLYHTCQKQSIAALAYTALESLSEIGQKPPINLLYEWICLYEQIKQQNKIVNRNTVELCSKLEKDGFDCCILKGQGNAVMYPDPYSRTPGDIDVWLRGERSKTEDVRNIIRYVKENGSTGDATYHHISLGNYKDTEVELHYRPSHLYNPKHNRRLQRWFSKMADGGWQMAELPNGAGYIRIPNREFNIVFQLSHVYNHLLHEGIGLRQIIDYYYLLKSDVRGNKEEVAKTLKYLGLEKIAGAVMWVLHEKLGLPEDYLIAPMDERRGKVLLDEIIRGGNFGHYDFDNIKATSRLKKNVQRVKRDLRLMRCFPLECLWEPLFRVYHLLWRAYYN